MTLNSPMLHRSHAIADASIAEHELDILLGNVWRIENLEYSVAILGLFQPHAQVGRVGKNVAAHAANIAPGSDII